MSAQVPVRLGMLVQERAIERTIHRYCRGIDRLLPEVYESPEIAGRGRRWGTELAEALAAQLVPA